MTDRPAERLGPAPIGVAIVLGAVVRLAGSWGIVRLEFYFVAVSVEEASQRSCGLGGVDPDGFCGVSPLIKHVGTPIPGAIGTRTTGLSSNPHGREPT